MSTKLNYKSGLLYLYWLMSGADGSKRFDPDDPEWRTMKQMRDFEDIGDDDFDNFINSDLGSSEEQLQKVIEILSRVSHEQKVRALAWMDLVMIADGLIHNKELELYTKVRQHYAINEDEVKSERLKLPGI